MLEQPQRHRGTETAQSQPPGVCPQITQMTQIAIATQRKGAETQRRKARKERRGAEAQRRRENPRQPDRPASSRPPGGRGPVGRAAVPNASVRRSHSTQRPALSESAGLASHVDKRSTFEQALLWRERRAPGAPAGAETVWDERLRSDQTGFAPGAGDRDRRRFRHTTPGNLVTAGTTPLRLCVSAPLRFFLCVSLCVSVPLWFFRCLGSSKTLHSRT